MAKLGCTCGHVISDGAVPSPWSGELLRDQDEGRERVLTRELIAYFRAPTAEARREWLSTWLDRLEPTADGERYHDCYGAMEEDDSDEIVIMNLLGYLQMKYFRQIHECTRCGRLWVEERPGSGSFLSYAPENGRYNGLLGSERPGAPAGR